MEQALINLLKNARESGSQPDDIELCVSLAAQGFVIEVRDRGPGFTAAALENALVPFYSTKETGTGLGLTLCREIVEAHGGRLRIANREGGGALVSLWLPDGLTACWPARHRDERIAAMQISTDSSPGETAVQIQTATPADLEVLLPMVEQYWRFEAIEGFDATRMRKLLTRVLEDSNLGRAWVARLYGEPAGYC